MSSSPKSVDEHIKRIIGNILHCSGEPVTGSSEVIDILFSYLCECKTQFLSKLTSRGPTLEDLLQLCRNEPLRLTRMCDYFRIVHSDDQFNPYSQQLDCSSTAIEPPVILKTDLIPCLSVLCNKLSIPLPSNSLNFLENHGFTPFVIGRRLRLARIDHILCAQTVDDYLAFTKLRQSASLLVLVKSHDSKSWFYNWLFSDHHTLESLGQTCPHQTLAVLTHLLTGDLLDVIDLVLFQRKRLHIDLHSPLTVIEVSQALRLKRKRYSSAFKM